MSLQSLDIIRRSATTTPSPEARGAHTGQVAKLIDVSKCIGCKAVSYTHLTLPTKA